MWLLYLTIQTFWQFWDYFSQLWEKKSEFKDIPWGQNWEIETQLCKFISILRRKVWIVRYELEIGKEKVRIVGYDLRIARCKRWMHLYLAVMTFYVKRYIFMYFLCFWQLWKLQLLFNYYFLILWQEWVSTNNSKKKGQKMYSNLSRLRRF